MARNTASVSFCAILILVLKKYKIGNIFTTQLGNCSFEIFLIHPHMISFLQKTDLPNDYIFSALVILTTLLASMILKQLEATLKKILEK